jgi:glutaredoxin 3
MVREFLSQKGINFEERDVSRNPLYAQELMTTTGQMGVPVTVIDGQVVIGFDRGRLQQLINTMQTKQRLSFGASIADASKITAQQSSGITLGAYVGRVKPGSLAERMGLTSGDIITELNMKTIANAKDLEDAISALNGGSRLSLIFIRDDRTISTEGTF